MNPVLAQLMGRRSVRAYLPQPVAEETVEAILAAAMRAPTAGNMMLYSIIRVQDQALKDRLAETCDHQPFIAKAPLVLVFLADYQRWWDAYQYFALAADPQEKPVRRPGEGDLLLAVSDTLIAAQSAVIAAEALGLGACYIGDILENYAVHRELFALPRFVLPVAMVCLGYPTPEASRRRLTRRFAPRHICFRDRYERQSKTDLAEMFREENRALAEIGSSYANAAQANYRRKFSADFSLEMTRSVREMIRSWCDEAEEAQ